MWTPSELKFLKSLNTPEKIQDYVDNLTYNPTNSTFSPRYTMITGEGHCFEGCLFAAAALEVHGYKPLLVDLVAHNDDDHVITVFKMKTGWGSIAKSNTTLLRGRPPFFKNIHELVMSYFPFYFNVAGKLSLYAYSDPINLNRYNKWNWRWTEDNLEPLGWTFCDLKHYELATQKELDRSSKVHKLLNDACFLGADPEGLYKV